MCCVCYYFAGEVWLWRTWEGSFSHSGYSIVLSHSPSFLHHFLLLSVSSLNIFTLEFELYADHLALRVNRCSRILKLLHDICYSCDNFFWFPSFSSSSRYSPLLSLWETSFLRAANQLPDGCLASHVNCRGNWVRRRSLIELIRGREWKQMERICGGVRVEADLHSIVGLH